MLSLENADAMATAYCASVAPYPQGAFSGRGIVTCAGGIKYLTCAWVLVKMLRRLGCILPIEVWYLGEEEGEPDWIELVRPLGVTCIDACQVRNEHPHPQLGGWQLKSYAALHSRFREVLFLDADNVPLVDPTFLFDSAEFQAEGAVFWPDFSRTPPGHPAWKAFGVAYREEPEFESGQWLVDKARCWQALSLCNWFNEHSDFFYRIVYGDKDTFRFAWHRLRQDFAMPGTPPATTPGGLAQHDFRGRAIFQHRTGDKWSIAGNRCPGAFKEYTLCQEFLAELRERWRPTVWLARRNGIASENLFGRLAGSCQNFSRLGGRFQLLEFQPHGHIGSGASRRQCFWWCAQDRLTLADDQGRPSAALSRHSDGSWLGTELRPGSICKVRLTPIRSRGKSIGHPTARGSLVQARDGR